VDNLKYADLIGVEEPSEGHLLEIFPFFPPFPLQSVISRLCCVLTVIKSIKYVVPNTKEWIALTKLQIISHKNHSTIRLVLNTWHVEILYNRNIVYFQDKIKLKIFQV
jgi:hypothetical protein